MNTKPDIVQLCESFTDKPITELLGHFLTRYGNRAALSSSLGMEDQILTHAAFRINPGARIFTLDTGRLFEQTYDLMAETMIVFGMSFEVYFPDAADVENLVRTKGPRSFYESTNNRKECCFIRKIKPLRRALEKTDVWITGLRRGQSDAREAIEIVEWVEDLRVLKINPLAYWTDDMVRSYVHENRVPCNRLHDEGFPSIGCEPCTRAVREGEDIRSGRWWWERSGHKECGLHARGESNRRPGGER
jgi:phosphoadenosine phosphosulfate reductase